MSKQSSSYSSSKHSDKNEPEPEWNEELLYSEKREVVATILEEEGASSSEIDIKLPLTSPGDPERRLQWLEEVRVVFEKKYPFEAISFNKCTAFKS